MLDRRGFLKFVGGGVVGTLATPVIWKSLDDISIWSQNWGWVPRLDYGNNENVYIRTASKLCPSAVGTRVRLVGGRPVRVLSDPEHPLSMGGISPLAASEVQLRYSPNRLKRPLKKSGDGAYKEITWEEAEKLLLDNLDKSRGPEGVACISGDENGTMNELLSGFLAQLGSDSFFVMPGEAQATAAAWKLMGGTGRIGYDFAKSDHIFAIGANVLESWGPVIGNRRAWGNARPIGQVPNMLLTYAGPVENNTAVGADNWLPIKPGSEGALLMGIANSLIQLGASAPVTDFQAFRGAAAKWTPEEVCNATGIDAPAFQKLFDAICDASMPLVIAGSDMDAGSGAAPIIAGIMVNLLLGNLNNDGGLRVIPVAGPVVNGAMDYGTLMSRDVIAYADAISKGKARGARTVIFYEANPVYGLPPKSLDALLKKADFKVAFSCFFDETAAQCDLIVPNALGLERLDDVANPFGYGEFLYSLCRPVAKPLFEARAAGDVILALAEKLELKLGVKSVPAMLETKAAKAGASWTALCEGKPFTSRATLTVSGLKSCGELINPALNTPASENLAVAFINKLVLGTAESGLPPLSLKVVSDEDILGNALIARINGATIKKLGIYPGQKIKLTGVSGSVTARVKQFEGVTNNTVALSMGLGHTGYGVYNDGKGMNVMSLLEAVNEPGTGVAIWSAAHVKAAKA